MKVARDGDTWRLDEVPAEATGPRLATRQPLAVEVGATGRATVTSMRGATVIVERSTGSVNGRVVGAGDHLALRSTDGALVGAWFATARGLEEVVVGEGALRYRLELPADWTMRQPAGRDELVELRDARDVSQLRFVARWAFDEAGERHRLRVRIDGDGVVVEAPSARGPLLIDPEWQDAGTPSENRAGAMVATLGDGDLMLVGGGSNVALPSVTADRFDPFTRTFSALPSVQVSRFLGTATTLRDGRVLLAGAGGQLGGEPAEGAIFDPVTETFVSSNVEWDVTAHTATRIDVGRHAGKILIAGGWKAATSTSASATDEVWLYDPVSDAREPLGPLAQARGSHRAASLPDGDVVFVGGYDQTAALASLERYDLATESSTSWEPLPAGRHATTALVLPEGGEGKVLVAGGLTQLVGGGLSDVLLYDVATGLASPVGALQVARGGIVATLLPGGDALLAGGGQDVLNPSASAAERFEVDSETLTPLGPPPGNFGNTTGAITATGEPLLLGESPEPLLFAEDAATVTVSGMATPMSEPSVTLLRTGEVLLTEGGAVELFDPRTRTFRTLGEELTGIGRWHRATTLGSGKVLLTGGLVASQATAGAVLLDPATDEVTTVQSMNQPRAGHLQTLLPGGRVLVAGGIAFAVNGPIPALESAEIFDPDDESFSLLPVNLPALAFGQAMLLGDGALWLWNGLAPLAVDVGPEVVRLDPTTLFRLDNRMSAFDATDGGTVGLRTYDGELLLLEPNLTPRLLDAENGVMQSFGTALWPTEPSRAPAIVALPTGRIAVVDPDEPELHLIDPRLNVREVTTLPLVGGGRSMDAATLLPDGGVLLAGADLSGVPSASVSIWYERPMRQAWLPTLTSPSALALGQATSLTGAGLLGVSEGISATSMAPANAPSAFFLFDDGGVARGSSTSWSSEGLSWRPTGSPFTGSGLVMTSTMGLWAGAPAVLEPGGLGAGCVADGGCATGFCVDGVCCESACEEPCFACSVAEGGVCTPVPEGTPDPACPFDDVATCRNPGTCDGAGSCLERYPNEAICSEAGDKFCWEGACEDQICDGDHTLLLAGEDVDCSPYVCTTEQDACRTTCDSNWYCVEGFVCSASGACVAPAPAAERLGCIPCAMGRRSSNEGGLAWVLALLVLGRRRSGRRSATLPPGSSSTQIRDLARGTPFASRGVRKDNP